MTPKEIKELLAYLRSIDISLGRIASALEKSDEEDEEDESELGCDIYEYLKRRSINELSFNFHKGGNPNENE